MFLIVDGIAVGGVVYCRWYRYRITNALFKHKDIQHGNTMIQEVVLNLLVCS